MRKIIAIVLCLAMVLCCAVSLGEEAAAEKTTVGTISINGAFTLKCDLPEGYKITPVKGSRDQVIAMIASDDPAKPILYLSVAFDETYADVERMNDLSEEEFAQLERTFTDVDPTIEITYGDTGYGTRLLIAKQTYETPNYIDFLSVYKGYFVEFVMIASQEGDQTLTDEQLAMCITFLTELDFIPEETVADDAGLPPIAEMTYIAELSNYDPETNTLDALLKHTILLTPEEAAALEEGGVLIIGQETVQIDTLETLEDGSLLINDNITLTQYGDDVHVFFNGVEYLEPFTTLHLEVPETLTLMDDIDPETGEDTGSTTNRTAAEFLQLLTGEAGAADPGFASDNVYLTFDENGQMSLLQRFPVNVQ